MSVDVRSRVDGPVEPIDPARFGDDLGNVSNVTAISSRRVDTFARRRGDRERRPMRGRLLRRRAGARHRAGDDAGAVLRLPATELADLVDDEVTVVGSANDILDQPAGRFDQLLDWWLLLRGAADGGRRTSPATSTSSTPTADP